MSSTGLLVSPAKEPSKEKLWSETWKRIDRFLPDLKNDLMPEEEDAAKEQPKSEGSAEKSG
jgi:golgi-specific brefeldin A-resistance guanine nucleotide exchange factor 1